MTTPGSGDKTRPSKTTRSTRMDDAEEGDDGEKRRSVTNREESSEHAQAGVGWRGSSSSKLVISYKI